MTTEVSDARLQEILCAMCGSLLHEHSAGERCLRFGDSRHPKEVSPAAGWKFKAWGAGNFASTDGAAAARRARQVLSAGSVASHAKVVTPNAKRKCTCDFKTVIMVTGCKCGGI